jgi:acetolactate synthase I/II/III large subunit
MRGADLLVKTLADSGVRHVSSLSGNQIMPIYDASIDSDVELYHVRQEAAAVHMADAWGRLTGQPGIALVTAGPGFANALSALYVAKMAESPMVLLSGHAPTNQLGRGAFQEMAQSDMARPVTKASWTVDDATQIGNSVAAAMALAVAGRPGPVQISLPVDLLEAPVEDFGLIGEIDGEDSDALINQKGASDALELLLESRRPLVLAGPALTRGRGRHLAISFAEKSGVPVIAMESPRGINDPSLGALAEVLAQADTVLLLGKKLDFTLGFGEPPSLASECRLIQIDPEPQVLEQTHRVLSDPSRLAVSILADPTTALDTFLNLIQEREQKDAAWYDEVQAAVSYRPAEWEALATEQDGPLHPVQVGEGAADSLRDDDAVFVSDGGEYGQWAQACLSASNRVINGPSGSIGSAIPFALAARLAFPNAPVMAFLGDGTMGFHLMEFDTAVRYNLPFTAVVGNDATWNAEFQIQLRDYGADRLVGCELRPTRYDEVVKALGGYGEHVSTPEQLGPALERARDSGLPACIDVSIQRVPSPVIRRG